MDSGGAALPAGGHVTQSPVDSTDSSTARGLRTSRAAVTLRWSTVIALSAGVAAALAGPAAYAVQTASQPKGGPIPTAGPTVAAGGMGGPGRGGLQAFPNGEVPNGFPSGFPGGVPNGFPNGATANGGLPGGTGDTSGGPAGGFGFGGGGMGGPSQEQTPPAELVTALRADADRYIWVAATIGAQTAAGYQLGANEPVMPIGGFSGSDPSPTLAEFQQYVADGRIHYFIGGVGSIALPAGGGELVGSQISTWVTSITRPPPSAASRYTTSHPDHCPFPALLRAKRRGWVSHVQTRLKAAVRREEQRYLHNDEPSPVAQLNRAGGAGPAILDVVIPVYNEESDLGESSAVDEHLGLIATPFTSRSPTTPARTGLSAVAQTLTADSRA